MRQSVRLSSTTSSLRGLLESALAAATVSGCCFGGRSYGPSEGDQTVPVDPALLKQGVADRDGFIDEETCRHACAGESGDIRSCRFTTRAIEKRGSTSFVTCYRFPPDGKKEYVTRTVPISEEKRQSLKPSGPRNTISGCFEFCDSVPGEGIMCTVEAGRPSVTSIEPVVVCHMYRPGGCGEISFGHGRAPEGLVAPRARAALGGFLSRAAYAERASIRAFRVLAHELGSLGAPTWLVGRALAAANDETRHARVMSRLARRHRASVDRVRTAAPRTRTLFEVARENAVEGCVNETFGALMALHQARSAEDPGLRKAMNQIAADEVRHAALAWDVRAWCDGSLSLEERRAIHESMRCAVESIATSASMPDRDVRRAAGLPDGASSARMVDVLRRTLWDTSTSLLNRRSQRSTVADRTAFRRS